MVEANKMMMMVVWFCLLSQVFGSANLCNRNQNCNLLFDFMMMTTMMKMTTMMMIATLMMMKRIMTMTTMMNMVMMTMMMKKFLGKTWKIIFATTSSVSHAACIALHFAACCQQVALLINTKFFGALVILMLAGGRIALQGLHFWISDLIWFHQWGWLVALNNLLALLFNLQKVQK